MCFFSYFCLNNKCGVILCIIDLIVMELTKIVAYASCFYIVFI